MKKYLIGFLAVIFGVLIALYPFCALSSAKDACLLCANTLIPSLLPALICSSLITSSGILNQISFLTAKIMNPLFSLNGSCSAPLLMGFLSGYPVGAISTCNLYLSGSASKNEAERLASFANNSGPLFILGTLGAGIFHNSKVGICLLLSHILASLLSGAVLGLFGKSSQKCGKIKQSSSLMRAVPDSVLALLNLCGFVIFFSVCTALLEKTGVLDLIARFISFFGIEYQNSVFIARGLFEITSAMPYALYVPLPIVSCLLSLGGLSVFAQTYSFLHRAGLSSLPYLAGKLLSGGFSAFITFFLSKFIL